MKNQHLYIRDNLIIVTHFSHKFITPTTFLNMHDFCKIHLYQGTKGVLFYFTMFMTSFTSIVCLFSTFDLLLLIGLIN